MPEPTQEDHFASAATRHFHDGDYLRKGSRLPSADHLYGFAAECAVKSLLLRFTEVTIGPLEGEEKPSAKPRVRHPEDSERIIEFGHVNELVGWAGWNHRHQAEALVNLLMDRSSVDGWSKGDPRFVPLLAGLQEIVPWVHQWYDAYDEEWGDNPAQEFQTALNRGSVERNLSQDDLRAWRPEKKRVGRKKAAE
ncbi:DUF7008 domain-containing protein [Streptomyces sp. BE133]|uniref:DUF7008 domain-containing protein n=1 Tax=Streptomyces sp. BE133 TaxID=3002523 RepID=UPI002E759E70|nr:hypothetical protein [Streptomyces sp. BE133]MEE1808462.1 hypothetical protein [Streptomyces sp. BE133]